MNPPELRPHKLRQTRGSLEIEKGIDLLIDLLIISRFLGYSVSAFM